MMTWGGRCKGAGESTPAFAFFERLSFAWIFLFIPVIIGVRVYLNKDLQPLVVLLMLSLLVILWSIKKLGDRIMGSGTVDLTRLNADLAALRSAVTAMQQTTDDLNQSVLSEIERVEKVIAMLKGGSGSGISQGTVDNIAGELENNLSNLSAISGRLSDAKTSLNAEQPDAPASTPTDTTPPPSGDSGTPVTP